MYQRLLVAKQLWCLTVICWWHSISTERQPPPPGRAEARIFRSRAGFDVCQRIIMHFPVHLCMLLSKPLLLAAMNSLLQRATIGTTNGDQQTRLLRSAGSDVKATCEEAAPCQQTRYSRATDVPQLCDQEEQAANSTRVLPSWQCQPKATLD